PLVVRIIVGDGLPMRPLEGEASRCWVLRTERRRSAMSAIAAPGRSEMLALNRRLTRRAAQLAAVNVELERIEELYATVMENMAEGLYVVDPAGRMLLMNSA